MTLSRLNAQLNLGAWQAPLLARWQALSLRDRRLLSLAGAVLGVFILWLLLIRPPLQDVRSAQVKLDQLDAQLQQMQRLAAESRQLHSTSPLSAAQSALTLKAATDRLGEKARLAVQGDRAVLTLTGISGSQLHDWLAEARSGARARPVEAQLSHGQRGYEGTIVVTLGKAA